MTLDKMIERAEAINADRKLNAQQKAVRLGEVMTDMEQEFAIPAIHDQKFDAAHPDVIKAYRKVSDMRTM